MTRQVLDENLIETDTDAPRQHVRRRKTLGDYVTTVSGITGAIAAVMVLTGSITDKLPFVQKEPYSRDWMANDIRMQRTEMQQDTTNKAMATIQRNGLLTLQLQFQQRADALAQTLKEIQPNSPNYYALSVALDEARQQVDEIKRQLSR